MNASFATRLMAAVEKKNNPSLLGLDTRMSSLPPQLLKEAGEVSGNAHEALCRAILVFNRELMEQLSDLVPAVKFQSAYYEQLGLPGLMVLRESLDYAKELGYLTILDAKRNDIGSSSGAYANATLGKTELPDGKSFSFMDADSVTINGYFGTDGIAPFIEYMKSEGKGCFVIVRTSNPTGAEFQDLVLEDGRRVYEAMAELVVGWSELMPEEEYSSVGAVVGATWPEEAKKLRKIMKKQLFLIPGYGAQGGTADGAVAGFDEFGKGGIVNSSRGLMQAWQKEENGAEHYGAACRRAALAMQKDLLEALDAKTGA